MSLGDALASNKQGPSGSEAASANMPAHTGINEVPPEPAQVQPAARESQSRAARPANNGWGDQSLGDCLAPKKRPQNSAGNANVSQSGDAKESCNTGSKGNSNSEGAFSKSTTEIVAWVRTLPESHVPEKSRENIICIVEDACMRGSQFSDYVKTIPPEVCAPKHAMKLKSAWKNVLAEVAAKELALANAGNQSKQKATMLVV